MNVGDFNWGLVIVLGFGGLTADFVWGFLCVLVQHRQIFCAFVHLLPNKKIQALFWHLFSQNTHPSLSRDQFLLWAGTVTTWHRGTLNLRIFVLSWDAAAILDDKDDSCSFAFSEVYWFQHLFLCFIFLQEKLLFTYNSLLVCFFNCEDG